MSFFTQFSSGPTKVTTYTSGSGNYTPISTNQSWARVTVVGGGGGGGGGQQSNNNANTGGGAGGGGGATRVEWIKLNSASYAYAVGAAGTGGNGAGNAGSSSRFGTIRAFGGSAGPSGIANQDTTGADGGIVSYIVTDATNKFSSGSGGFLSGGAGGRNQINGAAVGFPVAGTNGIVTASTLSNTYAGGGATNNSGTYGGGGGGGDSAYGTGGAGGAGGSLNTGGNAGSSASGYGGGGGGGGGDGFNIKIGGSGSGGLVIIEEFVQA